MNTASCPSTSRASDVAGQEVLARAGDIMIARSVFDVGVSLYKTDQIELNQGSKNCTFIETRNELKKVILRRD
jgi:hypothetical protein